MQPLLGEDWGEGYKTKRITEILSSDVKGRDVIVQFDGLLGFDESIFLSGTRVRDGGWLGRWLSLWSPPDGNKRDCYDLWLYGLDYVRPGRVDDSSPTKQILICRALLLDFSVRKPQGEMRRLIPDSVDWAIVKPSVCPAFGPPAKVFVMVQGDNPEQGEGERT